MATTTRLGLTKPAGSDLVNIDVLNTNSDLLDSAIGAKVVTSGTRPSTPFNGQLIYEADTAASFVYVSATSSWVPITNIRVQETAPSSPVLNMIHLW